MSSKKPQVFHPLVAVPSYCDLSHQELRGDKSKELGQRWRKLV